MFEPALPGRNKVARGSPVPNRPWSMKEHKGWKPKPFLHVGRASSFSEWEFTKEASRSMIRGLSLLAPCRGGSSRPAPTHAPWMRPGPG